jgi:hypothetical protein
MRAAGCRPYLFVLGRIIIRPSDTGARASSPASYAASQAQRIDKIPHFPLLQQCSQTRRLRSQVSRPRKRGRTWERGRPRLRAMLHLKYKEPIKSRIFLCCSSARRRDVCAPKFPAPQKRRSRRGDKPRCSHSICFTNIDFIL